MIIQLGRLRDKSRKVVEITEILACVDGEILLNPLYVFRETGETADGRIEGELRPTGNCLTRRNKLLAAGLTLPEGVVV